MKIYLLKDGQQIGPLEEDAVRADLLSGEYSETTYALVEGEPEWRTLGEIFPSIKDPSSVLPLPTVPEPSPAQPTTKSSVKATALIFLHKLLRWFAVLGSDIASIVKPALAELKRRVQLMALGIRLFSANHFILRKRYCDLGRQCYEARSFETVFVEEYKTLTDLTSAIRDHRRKLTTPEHATAIERIQVAANNAARIIAAEVLTFKFNKLFINLGEKAAQQGCTSDIAHKFDAVMGAKTVIATLDKKYSTLSSDRSKQDELNKSFKTLVINFNSLSRSILKKARSILVLPIMRKAVLPAIAFAIFLLTTGYIGISYFLKTSEYYAAGAKKAFEAPSSPQQERMRDVRPLPSSGLFSDARDLRTLFGPAVHSIRLPSFQDLFEEYEWKGYRITVCYSRSGEDTSAELIICWGKRERKSGLLKDDFDFLLNNIGVKGAPDIWRPLEAGPAGGPETLVWVFTTPRSKFRDSDLRSLSDEKKRELIQDDPMATVAYASLVKPTGSWSILSIETVDSMKKAAAARHNK